MDSRVTVRFFKVKKRHSQVADFESACQAALDLGDQPCHRERDTPHGLRLRMERFQKDGEFFCGEMVRVQKDNIPPEATASGLTPLKVGGLGHAVAFRYHPGTKVAAIQFDARAVSVARFAEYLDQIDHTYDFRFEPLVTQNAWERYQDGSPRKLEIAIASPANLAEVEGKVGALTDASRKLGEIADAPLIRIEISMGSKRKGFLDKDFATSVINYFTKGGGKLDDIRTLRATVKDESEDVTDSIDFLDEKLYCREDIELPTADADKHYEARKSFLKRCFSEHLDYIVKVYSKAS